MSSLYDRYVGRAIGEGATGQVPAPVSDHRGADGAFGTRLTLHDLQVQHAIAQFLLQSNYLIDTGPTEMVARQPPVGIPQSTPMPNCGGKI